MFVRRADFQLAIELVRLDERIRCSGRCVTAAAPMMMITSRCGRDESECRHNENGDGPAGAPHGFMSGLRSSHIHSGPLKSKTSTIAARRSRAVITDWGISV